MKLKGSNHCVWAFLVNFRIIMKKLLFKLLAKINKAVLPSYSKRQLDLSKASKLQLAIIGWRAFVTMKTLD